MSIDTVMERINGKYGSNTLVRASDARGLRINHFSTGSHSLDIALGGGFAQGRLIEIIGNYSSYKSTLVLCSAGKYIRADPNHYVIYVDPEGTFDTRWLKFLGGDPTRFLLCSPLTGELAGDVVCDALREGDPVLILIDSIAALMPAAEMDGKQDTLEKNQPGSHARLMSKMFRKMTALIRKDLTSDEPRSTVICLNQIRMKIGLLFGNPETGTGGRAKDFFVSQQLIMKRDEFIYEGGEDGSDVDTKGGMRQAVGATVRFHIPKNKCGGAQNEIGKFTFYNRDYGEHRGGTIDNAADVLPYAILHGLVKRTGQSFAFQGKKFQGQKRFMTWLRAHPKVQRLLHKELLSIRRRRYIRSAEKKPSRRVSF